MTVNSKATDPRTVAVLATLAADRLGEYYASAGDVDADVPWGDSA